jgi:hypothetical protein
VQSHGERHEGRETAQRRDVDAGKEAGEDADGERGEHGQSEEGERELLRGEAPVGRIGVVVEPRLVGEEGRHAIRIDAGRVFGFRTGPRTRCGFPRIRALLEWRR